MLKNQLINKNCKGMTLTELLVVISIIAALVIIAIPAYFNFVNNASKHACDYNRLQLHTMYYTYLIYEELEHTDTIFNEYIEQQIFKVCPDNGTIHYIDAKVRCSIHSPAK